MKKFILFFVFAIFCFISNVAAQTLGEQQGGIGIDPLAIQVLLSDNGTTVNNLDIFLAHTEDYSPNELFTTLDYILEISIDGGLNYSYFLSVIKLP